MSKRTRRDFLRIGGAGALAAAGLAACSAPAAPSAPAQPPAAPTSFPAAPAQTSDQPPKLVSADPRGPQPKPPAASSPPPPPSDRRILVVLQLSGGDDGLNMLVPYGDGLYYDLRPQLGIPADQVLRLSDQLGLHPSLKAFKGFYDQGKLAFVQGVGYENPSRSHFRSMDIWHTARTDASGDQGWLGAFMKQVYRVNESPFQCVNLGLSVPKALLTEAAPTAALQDSGTFHFLADRKLPNARDPLLKTFGQMYARPAKKLPALQLVADTWEATTRGVDALGGAAEKYQPAAQYPNHPFGKALQQVAQMLAASLGTRIFYVSLGGFDTHANEKADHARLLTLLSDGLAAFNKDLEAQGRTDEVLVLAFSEFGRRVRENGSGGSDHGAAGPMFAFGNGVRGGLYGDHPSLSNLDDGDLRFTVDFRQVYATILEDWLGASSKSVLGGSYDRLGFIRA